ncbi:hypothetical protein CVAR21S_02487 [Corynebacterium variabile]
MGVLQAGLDDRRGGLRAGTREHGLPDLPGGGAQYGLQPGVHLVGVAGVEGLAHRLLRHDAVLADEVDQVVPPAAVMGDVGQQAVDQAVVGVGDSGTEELVEASQCVVRLLDLVVELEVRLRELEVLDVEALGDTVAEDVEPGEHPAAAGLLLVGDAQGIELHLRRRVDSGDRGPVEGDTVDVCRGYGVGCDTQRRVGRRGVTEFREHPGGEGEIRHVSVIRAAGPVGRVYRLFAIHSALIRSRSCPEWINDRKM